MSDSGGKQETQSDPWKGLQPYLMQGYGAAAQNILGQPTFVGFSPETEQALEAQTARAQAGNPLLGLAQQQTAATLGGEYLGQTPYLDQLQESVMSTVMPGVDSQFGMASGRFGSPLHAEALSRGVTRGMAPYLFGEYGAERGRMMDASRMAPGLGQADYFDIGQLAQVGQMRRGLEQERLMEPGQRTMQYLAALGGTAPLLAGTGTSTQRQFMNPLMMGLGAGTTLAGAALPMFIG